jgi:2-hydroxychromene-2-carboxylate isomerase
MNEEQPKALALALADALDAGENYYAESSMWFDRALAEANGDAAAELRRLHTENEAKDALLRQAQEALERGLFKGELIAMREQVIAALKERLKGKT